MTSASSPRTRQVAPLTPSRRMVAWLLAALGLASGVLLALAIPFEGSGLAIVAVLAGTPAVVIGLLLTTRRPELWIGTQLVGLGVVPMMTYGIESWAVLAADGALPGSGFARVVGMLSWPLWWVAPILIGLTFPDGRILGPRPRAVGWLVALTPVVLVAGLALDPATWRQAQVASPWPAPPGWVSAVVVVLGLGLLIASLTLAVAGLVLRYRRGETVTRLQLRWLGLGFLALPIGLATGWVLGLAVADADGTVALGLMAIGWVTIPVAVGIAVTRHGLYAIGRVVSRTVSYLMVTAVVVGVYAVVVTTVSQLVPASSSSVVVAGATLAAAAVFLPALRFVQRFVDRRFDRERYDAAQVVDAFREKLRASVEPDRTAGELLQAVEQTLQPTSIGLWLGERP